MELRPAELEDLRACAALPKAVASSYVWQLTFDRDAATSVAAGELGISLRRLRLPRQITVAPPGEPLEAVWDRAVAVFVAEVEAGLAGFVALTRAEERPAANLARLVVMPEWRRQGVATALVRVAARWSATEGLTGLTAHCSARNDPAVAFYTRTGFTFTGFSEAYYPRGEVALFWQRGI